MVTSVHSIHNWGLPGMALEGFHGGGGGSAYAPWQNSAGWHQSPKRSLHEVLEGTMGIRDSAWGALGSVDLKGVGECDGSY